MEQLATPNLSIVPTKRLRELIEQTISERSGIARPVDRLDRRLSKYSSSFAIEEVDVHFSSGAKLQLMFKNLSWQSLLKDARRVRPAFVYDARREIRTYQNVLADAGLGTPILYGSLANGANDSYFLFIERVEIAKLCHIGNFAVWERVAQWLARMHLHFAACTASFERSPHLLKYDASLYRIWMERACALFCNDDSPHADADRRSVEWLASRYEPVVQTLASMPRTFLHGEFYASNILADESGGRMSGRVCAVDWEMAAVGPGLLDLAALVAGSWTDERRDALARAYYDITRGTDSTPFETWAAFAHALDCCRLHLAVQYLGWATEWSPPSDQKQDWLGEAMLLAEKLRL